MFALLFSLTAGAFAPIPDLVDSWHPAAAPAKKESVYMHTIRNDAKDGIAFVKPARGHEDGCVMGVCSETATALGNDGVLHAPAHKPVLRFL
jgi:hypothetical protein